MALYTRCAVPQMCLSLIQRYIPFKYSRSINFANHRRNPSSSSSSSSSISLYAILIEIRPSPNASWVDLLGTWPCCFSRSCVPDESSILSLPRFSSGPEIILIEDQ